MVRLPAWTAGRWIDCLLGWLAEAGFREAVEFSEYYNCQKSIRSVRQGRQSIVVQRYFLRKFQEARRHSRRHILHSGTDLADGEAVSLDGQAVGEVVCLIGWVGVRRSSSWTASS